MALSLVDLLSKGYFPKELPPPFSTTIYGNKLAATGVSLPITEFRTAQHYSMQCSHNFVRAGGLRRNLAIPNPKHFLLLSEHIVNNWNNIVAVAQRSPYSMTRPTDMPSDRAISPEHSLTERSLKIAEIRASGRFILKVDIARFFPSIYTHSIPWALMGKARAKSAHTSGTLKGMWQDKCDSYSQKINSNQTIGIPIGPDTSRLFAEVILSEIDTLLAAKFKKINGLRYIDDYEFSFDTRSEAEQVLNYLQYLLNDFELAINISKTRIIELPEELESFAVAKLRTFNFRVAGTVGQRNDLISYFNLVFEMLKKAPEEGLIKYSIARLNGEQITQDNWTFYQNVLSQCIMIEPACLPQVCNQIIKYKNIGYRMANRTWEKCLNTIIIDKAPLGFSSESAWAIWLAKILNIKLSVNAAKAISNCDDSIVCLMGLGLASIGLTQMKYFNNLYRFASSNELFEKQWLLCYQGNLNGWLGNSSGRHNLKRDTAFDYMQQNDISFFDIGVTVPTITTSTGGSSSGGY